MLDKWLLTSMAIGSFASGIVCAVWFKSDFVAELFSNAALLMMLRMSIRDES